MTDEQNVANKFNWLDVLNELDAIHRLAEAGVMATDSLDDSGERDPLAQVFDVIGQQIRALEGKVREIGK